MSGRSAPCYLESSMALMVFIMPIDILPVSLLAPS